jgi:hypothetical protein
LELVVGEGVKAKLIDPQDLGDKQTATFICDDNELVAMCACDTNFVVYSGTALSMIPSDVANEMIKDNDVSETVYDNFYEIMNICSKLLMSDTSDHLRLDKSLSPQDSAEPLSALEGGSSVTSFMVEIPGYGEGELSFKIAA